MSEALADAEAQERGALSRVTDEAGSYWVPNAPFQMPGLNTAVRSQVPSLNEHGEEILSGLLHYSEEQRAACATSSEQS